VTGKLPARHRAADFRDFPDETGRQARPGPDIHVIRGSLSARKAPAVHRRLLARPAALHAGLFIADQPGRTVVRRAAAALPGPRSVLPA
jgi:hypothetical protein